MCARKLQMPAFREREGETDRERERETDRERERVCVGVRDR